MIREPGGIKVLGKLIAWLRDENLAQLASWARAGWGMKQMAEQIGVHPDTLRRWSRMNEEVAAALLGEDKLMTPVEKVEEALYQKALEGSVTAQLYWLKNRDPRRWRDKPEAKADGSGLEELLAAIAGSAEPDLEDEENGDEEREDAL